MVEQTVARRSDADQIAALLDSPEITQLINELAATPDPPGNGPVEEALPAARVGRAGERPAQARVGAAAAPRPPHRAGAAPRRPDHLGPVGLRAR